MPAYQIKFCTFTFVKQEDAYMNRIKEALDAKGISQTELANKLGKTFNIANLYATNGVLSFRRLFNILIHLYFSKLQYSYDNIITNKITCFFIS